MGTQDATRTWGTYPSLGGMVNRIDVGGNHQARAQFHHEHDSHIRKSTPRCARARGAIARRPRRACCAVPTFSSVVQSLWHAVRISSSSQSCGKLLNRLAKVSVLFLHYLHV